MKKVGALFVGLMCVASCASTGTMNTVDGPPANEAFPRGYLDLQGQTPAIESTRLVAVSATVIAKNTSGRSLEVKDPTGNVVALKIGDQVRNLDKVEVGDQVVASYYTVLAIRVNNDEKGGASGEELGARVKPRGMPAAGGVVTEETASTAAITAIDMDATTLVLQGPYRDVHTIKVRDPGNLQRVSVGDHVTITYIESVAISVEKPSAWK